MKVLMVGHGNGSWVVRAQQLGAALRARLSSAPDESLLRWADVVVLIKRADSIWSEKARALGKPVVWDALDFWQQPEQNDLAESEAIRLLHAQIARYRPALVIGATEAMASAAGGVYLPHHSRPGLAPAPPRDAVTTVAYEGTKKFLGRWYKAVEIVCHLRGWRFLINPPDLRSADLIVGFRDGQWDGGMCRDWKSGVKVVNAMAAGRPIITTACAAMRELPAAGSMIESIEAIPVAFDHWSGYGIRARAYETSLSHAPAYTLNQIAARYCLILQQVVSGREVMA